MGGAASRRKGHSWEREVAIRLRAIFPNARRGLSQTRDGSDVPDVEGTPFWVEAKKGKRTNPRAALAQATEASQKKSDHRPPVAICYDDRERPVAMMYLDDWIDLLGAFHHAIQAKDTSVSSDKGRALLADMQALQRKLAEVLGLDYDGATNGGQQ